MAKEQLAVIEMITNMILGNCQLVKLISHHRKSQPENLYEQAFPATPEY